MNHAGTFTVPPDHPSLPGHFPGKPIIPGVLLLDHAATLILALEPGRSLAGFPAIRFTRPVRPGETVSVRYAQGRFTAHVNDAPAFSGTIAFQ